MFITQCDLSTLIQWFQGTTYEVMAIYLSGGTPSDNVILSNTIDNWREIDNLSRNMVCYIYFDQNDIQTDDTSIVNFVSWVREYNYVDNRDYRKDADASIRITREICDRYNIFEYELPGLLFIDKTTNSHLLVPVEHFNVIKQYLSIINIVSSFAHDVSMAISREESAIHRIDEERNSVSQEKSAKEVEIEQLKKRRNQLEQSISQMREIDTVEIENDFERVRKCLSSFSEIANDSGLPSDIRNIQNIKKYLRKQKIESTKEYDEILYLTHNCICSLAAKYHLDKNIIIDLTINDLTILPSMRIQKINDSIERLSLRKNSLEDQISLNCADFKSLLEKENELIQSKIHIMNTAQEKYQMQLNKIIDVYSNKLNDILDLDKETCKELLQGFDSQDLFGFIKSMCEKQFSFNEEQDIKLTRIRSAISKKQYDVFISSNSEDYRYALDVYDYLESIGKHPFLANKSIDEIHCDEYNIVIREAIDVCPDMIVVLSNPDFANTPYVYFEWNLFVNEKAAGRKSGNLIPIIDDLRNIPLLPIALRQCQACTFSNYLDVLHRYLS